MIYTHAIAAIAALLAGLFGGWTVQGWRLGEQIAASKAAQSAALVSAIEGARTQEAARFTTLQKAQDDATKRAQTARNDAAAARTELDSLRNTIAAARGGVPGEPAAACIQRADTSGDVLAQCAGAYQELAGVADRLNADRLMLLEAWPK